MRAMKLSYWIRRLVSLCVLLGMLTAPVSTTAAERAMAAKIVASTVAAMTMEKMHAMQAVGVPCCPDSKCVKPDCDRSCPFIIICTSSAAYALPRTNWSAARLSWTSHVYADMQFDRLPSLAAEPPARPPKA